MDGRGRAAPGRRRRPGSPGRPAPVPFLLAAPRRPEALAATSGAPRRLGRLVAAWDRLRPLEEACWRGELGPRGLLRLQRARLAYAALLAEAEP